MPQTCVGKMFFINLHTKEKSLWLQWWNFQWKSYLLPCSMKFAPARSIDHAVSADGDCFHSYVAGRHAPHWEMKNIIRTNVVVFHSSEVHCNENLKKKNINIIPKLPSQWYWTTNNNKDILWGKKCPTVDYNFHWI